MGIALGYKIKLNEKHRIINDKVSVILIIFLLFTMGIQLGINKEILTKIPVLGFKALFIAMGTIAGSIVAVKLFLLKNQGDSSL
jgi:uncharacterized membrane protein YbjE (DUF340 family)